jgi:hypothetical protein
VLGTVTVRRCAIRTPGRHNRYPADEQLALPKGRHSHGLAKLAVVEAVRRLVRRRTPRSVAAAGT